VKRVAGTCIELSVYICQLLLFVMIYYFQCRNSVCYVEPSTMGCYTGIT
jgi:hypothetical protein